MGKRTITLEQLDGFQVDDDGRLYWQDKAVVLEQKLTLNTYERVIAFVAAIGALLAGVHPFGVTLGWWH